METQGAMPCHVPCKYVPVSANGYADGRYL